MQRSAPQAANIQDGELFIAEEPLHPVAEDIIVNTHTDNVVVDRRLRDELRKKQLQELQQQHNDIMKRIDVLKLEAYNAEEDRRRMVEQNRNEQIMDDIFERHQNAKLSEEEEYIAPI
jgi:tRNA U34 5-carboxymethylaminomethyl modifying GTPase MnmE/TrmE